MLLSREDILAAKDIITEKMEIPEWGGEIYVKALTSLEYNDYTNSLYKIQGKEIISTMKNAQAKLVQKCIVDENGKQLFTVADISALGEKNAVVISRIFQKINDMSGLTQESKEEIEKN